MNCAITVIQPDTKPPSPAPTPTARAVKPTAAPAAAKPIKSTDDLIKEFPDWFTGIVRFPGEDTIWLHPDVHPIIHAPQEIPHLLTSKDQGASQQNGMHGSDHLCESAHGLGVINDLCPESKWQAMSVFRPLWPQGGHLLWSQQDTYCGGSCPWIHALLLLHKVGCPPQILVNCSWSGIQPTHNLQQSLQKIPLPASSLWPCLFPRYLPEEDGPDSRRVSRMHWDHRGHHCPWSYQSRPWCPSLEPHACCLQIWVSVQPTKRHVMAPPVNFFGCLYDADGVHPDLNKVNAIHALPVPTNVTKLQEFLGMVMYLSSFILGLSTLTAPLCELLKKDTDFTWNPTYNAAFQGVKDAIISDTTLWYFDPSLPVTIQVDALQIGLGAALFQNHKPVAFASKALTNAKHSYTNIEREMLTVIFGPQPWNASPRRTWQTHQPSCSTCYCASRAMTTFSITAPVRKWPCQMPSLTSVYFLALTFHWILPFIMLTCPQTGRKHFNKPSWVIQRCMPLLTSSSPVHQMISRRFLTTHTPTGNIMRPSLLKMVLSSVEKPSFFLLQKGRE